VATLGVTFTCQYEPVKDIADALDLYHKETGLDIPMHIDAASGGFIAPFNSPDLVWDFRIERVKSINSSGHKFGLSPLGVGWIIWRDKDDLSEDLIFRVNYLGDNIPTFALNFSRPGGQVIAQYYNFLRLGKEGYRKIHNSCYQTAAYLADALDQIGLFDIIYDGRGGIPAVCWSLKENVISNFSLYDLGDKLRGKGWQVPAYSMPANRENLVVQRILVRHGVSRDLGDMLINDIKQAINYFKKNPVRHFLNEKEAGGFTH
jgi:glutamate decarboxylase